MNGLFCFLEAIEGGYIAVFILTFVVLVGGGCLLAYILDRNEPSNKEEPLSTKDYVEYIVAKQEQEREKKHNTYPPAVDEFVRQYISVIRKYENADIPCLPELVEDLQNVVLVNIKGFEARLRNRENALSIEAHAYYYLFRRICELLETKRYHDIYTSEATELAKSMAQVFEGCENTLRSKGLVSSKELSQIAARVLALVPGYGRF